jgi:hypothetical protein
MDQAAPGELSRKLKIVLVAFICCCLLSTVRIVWYAPKPGHVAPDNIAKRSDQRFATVRSALPGRGIIGYVGENGESSLPDYYLAQYALAPLVVDRSIQHKFVIGNFPSGDVPASLPGLRKIQDFGNGVVLLTSEDGK